MTSGFLPISLYVPIVIMKSRQIVLLPYISLECNIAAIFIFWNGNTRAYQQLKNLWQGEFSKGNFSFVSVFKGKARTIFLHIFNLSEGLYGFISDEDWKFGSGFLFGGYRCPKNSFDMSFYAFWGKSQTDELYNGFAKCWYVASFLASKYYFYLIQNSFLYLLYFNQAVLISKIILLFILWRHFKVFIKKFYFIIKLFIKNVKFKVIKKFYYKIVIIHKLVEYCFE